MRRLRVHFLPELVRAEELATANPLLFDDESQIGGTCVVIDVLRATTTIVSALAAGARAVWPYGSVEEARAGRSNWARSVFCRRDRGDSWGGCCRPRKRRRPRSCWAASGGG